MPPLSNYNYDFDIPLIILFRERDLPKINDSPPNWLDETVRSAIKKHLSKIPAPIARQYLIQEYTAARPTDIRLMMFNCLIEEQGSWYIKFYQNKVDRWHKLPANNEIRRIIEQQQQWVHMSLVVAMDLCPNSCCTYWSRYPACSILVAKVCLNRWG